MWPFKSKPPPADVMIDGVTVRYSRETKQWEFMIHGIEFTMDGDDFDPVAIGWAMEALSQLRLMERPLLEAAKQSLSEYEKEINLGSACLLNVDISEFGSNHYLIASYIGDETWGDLGVAVTMQNGTIIAADGAD